jgi:hypothetical protein
MCEMAQRKRSIPAACVTGTHPQIDVSKFEFAKGRVTRRFGAGEGIRTLDPNLGKVVLYP